MPDIENHNQIMLSIGELKGLIIGIKQKLFRIKSSKFISFNRLPIIPRFVPLNLKTSFLMRIFLKVIYRMTPSTKINKIISIMRIRETFFQGPIKNFRGSKAIRIFTFISFSIINLKPKMYSFITNIVSFPHRIIFPSFDAFVMDITTFSRTMGSRISTWKNLKLFAANYTYFIYHISMIS
jgi:hypothetical protein